MLLTHFGVSGPLVLTASAYIAEDPAGTYTKIRFTEAEDVTDCVKPDGSPIRENVERGIPAFRY